MTASSHHADIECVIKYMLNSMNVKSFGVWGYTKSPEAARIDLRGEEMEKNWN
jgi:hypothetical protein